MAAEASQSCRSIRNMLNKAAERQKTPGGLVQRYFEKYAQFGEVFDIPLRVPEEMHENLTQGKAFNEEYLAEAREFGLSYTPEAYRSFLNYFVYLSRTHSLHKEFGSVTFLYFGLESFARLGLITQSEWDHLPNTNMQLVSNLTLDLSDPKKIFMSNKRLFSRAKDVQDLPRATHGRPRILLHGRFNGFPTLNYIEAIFSIATAFKEPPCLIIGVDGDLSSAILKGQAPFMNQVFRAGFYTMLPFVDGVFLAAPSVRNYDEYWGGVYEDMELDFLALEESDPLLNEKAARFKEATAGEGRVFLRKSEYSGIPRLSGTALKSGDPAAPRSADAQWRGLTLNLFEKYFKNAPGQFAVEVVEEGSRGQPTQIPLVGLYLG